MADYMRPIEENINEVRENKDNQDQNYTIEECSNIPGNEKNIIHKRQINKSNKRIQTPQNLSLGTPRKNSLRKQLASAKRQLAILKEEKRTLQKANQYLKASNKTLKLENEKLKSLNLDKNFNIKEKFLNDDFLNDVEGELSAGSLTLIKNELQNANKSKVGRRYSDATKRFSLMMYFIAPNAYNFLKDVLKLPCKVTLQKCTRAFPSGPGIHNGYFEILEVKGIGMSLEAKNCVIAIDEISIKGHLFYDRATVTVIGLEDDGDVRRNLPARNALVIMARGITEKWKQLLGYALVNSTCQPYQIKKLLFQAIRGLQNIKFKPRLVVSDQGGNFQRLTEILNVSAEKPYFYVQNVEHMNNSAENNNIQNEEFRETENIGPSQQTKLYYMFDVPHLIKNIRTNFKNYLVKYDEDKKATWDHIEALWDYDSKRNLKLAPKLTVAHINPNNFEKMKVKYATQVLSNTVAAGIKTLVEGRILPSGAIETAEFVEFWNNAFDIFNSSPNKMRRWYSGDQDQVNFLEKMEQRIKSIRLETLDGTDRTRGVKCLDGWLLDIASLKGLSHDMKVEENVNSIFCRRLNQDFLEHAFCTIRKQGGNSRNPTSIQFIRAFKKLSYSQLLQLTATGNCELEQEAAVSLFEQHYKSNIVEQPVREDQEYALIIRNNDYRNLNFGEENALNYFAGYLLKKCREIHKCNHCENDVVPSTSGTFINHKQYDGCYLVIPPSEFVSYISVLEDNFIEHFDRLAVSNEIGRELYGILCEIPPYQPCVNFPLNYLIKYFIRIRLYYVLKFYNIDKGKKSFRNKLLTVKHL